MIKCYDDDILLFGILDLFKKLFLFGEELKQEICI